MKEQVEPNLARQLADIEAFKESAKKFVKAIKLGVWYKTKDANFHSDSLVAWKLNAVFGTRGSPCQLNCIAERVVFDLHKGYCSYEPHEGLPYRIGVRLLDSLIDDYKEASEAEVTVFLL